MKDIQSFCVVFFVVVVVDLCSNAVLQGGINGVQYKDRLAIIFILYIYSLVARTPWDQVFLEKNQRMFILIH